MSISTIIIGTLLFALAVSIIYIWGMKKQQDQSKDLMNMLFSKGQSRIHKYLKENDHITQKEAEELCEGMMARLPFSSNKAVVTDKKDFTTKLLNYMIKTGQLVQEGKVYKKEK